MADFIFNLRSTLKMKKEERKDVSNLINIKKKLKN